MKDKKAQIERIARYDHFIQARAGRAVRPYRMDGYVNFLNKYGTSRDSSETYQFVGEPEIPDSFLTEYYESNGLFAKIIDAPAEEAVKNGFELLDITDDKIINFYKEGLDELDWEDVFSQGMKWQRLFGGAIAVMLINDGHGIDEPLDWKHIKSIDDIVLFDRSVVEPDYASLYHYDPRDPFSTRGSRLGSPEYYRVSSIYGNFIVHESRVLEFKNGVLPENTMHTNYRTWGLPEYLRINRAIRDAEVSHGTASKLLDRSIQAVYKMKNLSEMLSTQDGEDMVLRRMQVIDMARGLLSSMVIDAEGEDYGFQTFTFTGVADVIDTTCNFVSALTNIPQTILFGKAPQGFSTNDESGLETWYSYVRRLQKRSMRSNLRYLLSVLFQAGLRTGEIEEIPEIKIEFNPLKVVSETEQLDIDQKRAQVQLTKAQTAQAYIDMQVMDPTEVRNNLAKSEEFDIENVLDDYDEEELFENDPSQQEPEGGMPGMEGAPGMEGMPPMEQGQDQPQAAEGSAAPNAPAATKLPQDMTEEDLEQAAEKNLDDESADARLSGVGVLVVRDGKILCGTRNHDTGYGLICGPGGHIEDGETSEEAAIREAQEEFSITPKAIISLGNGPIEPETNTYPEIFLCTEWEGEPKCESDEMTLPKFLALDEIYALGDRLFQPFADGVELLVASLVNDEFHEDSAEKNIDFRSVCDNVSLRDFILQFADSETQREDFGVKGMKWGHRKMSEDEKNKIRNRVVGQTASNGVTVSGISEHAFDRLSGRLISPGQVEALLKSTNVSPSETDPDCDVFDIPGKRLVMNKRGNIVSVMWRRNNK